MAKLLLTLAALYGIGMGAAGAGTTAIPVPSFEGRARNS